MSNPENLLPSVSTEVPLTRMALRTPFHSSLLLVSQLLNPVEGDTEALVLLVVGVEVGLPVPATRGLQGGSLMR